MEKRRRNIAQSRICRLFIGICLLIVLSIPVSAIQYDPPRASNYDFDYPLGEIDSAPRAYNASNHQDMCSYEGDAYLNSSATPAWTRMADDAIFSFIGHGSRDGGVLCFWNGTNSSILAEYRGYVPEDQTDYRFLSSYSDELNDLLLTTYITCNSAKENEYVGNLTNMSYQKGMDTTLGFTTEIGQPQAKDFSWKYWYNLAIYNWTVSTSADSAKYYAAVWNWGNFSGIQNYVIVGNPQLTIKPARYGS